MRTQAAIDNLRLSEPHLVRVRETQSKRDSEREKRERERERERERGKRERERERDTPCVICARRVEQSKAETLSLTRTRSSTGEKLALRSHSSD